MQNSQLLRAGRNRPPRSSGSASGGVDLLWLADEHPQPDSQVLLCAVSGTRGHAETRHPLHRSVRGWSGSVMSSGTEQHRGRCCHTADHRLRVLGQWWTVLSGVLILASALLSFRASFQPAPSRGVNFQPAKRGANSTGLDRGLCADGVILSAKGDRLLGISIND